MTSKDEPTISAISLISITIYDQLLLLESNEFYNDTISPRAVSDSNDNQERHQVDVGRNGFAENSAEALKKDKEDESQNKLNKEVADDCQRKTSLEEVRGKTNKKLYRVRVWRYMSVI